MIDIDQFKRFNDHFGHLDGDECIKAIALAIHNAANRPTDVAARYGGEEFALILPNTDQKGAAELLGKLLKTVEGLKQPHAPDSIYPHVTVSIGYSTLAPGKTSSNDLAIVNAADNALYASKSNGRNQLSYTELN